MTKTLTLDQCPESVQAYFLAMPAFQNAMRITKSATTGSDKTQVVKTLKTSRIIPREEKVLKAVNTGGFASILAGSNARNIGTPAPPVKIAPAPVAKPISQAPRHTPASVGKPLPQAFNTPKLPSKHDPVTYASLQAAIDTAMGKQRDDAKAEAFNEKRSAFARIHKSTAPDTRSGTGNAHALRSLGGRMAAAILGDNARKSEGKSLPTNTGFRAVSGASLKA